MATEKGLIFGSMACCDWSFLETKRDWPHVVIAADGGVRCAAAAGFRVDVYIGDSDSGGQAEPGMEAIHLRPEKDVTDLQAAYEWARDHGIREMIFTGCTGGRQDHHLSALQLLETAARDGVHGMVMDERNCIEFLLPGTYRVEREDYDYFSLVPVDRELVRVTIQNAKYTLRERNVVRGDSLTISNEWQNGPAEIAFDGGCCFLVRAKG